MLDPVARPVILFRHPVHDVVQDSTGLEPDYSMVHVLRADLKQKHVTVANWHILQLNKPCYLKVLNIHVLSIDEPLVLIIEPW